MRASFLARSRPTLAGVAACVGLAASNWLRVGFFGFLLAGVACVVASVFVSGMRRFAVLAAVLALTGLWWGGVRLDAFAQSALAPEIGRSAEFVAVVVGPVRHTRFSLRVAAEVRAWDGRPLRERVLLELPIGRSPPEGGVIRLRALIEEPRHASEGFDERAWLARSGAHVVLRGRADWRLVGRRGGLAGLGDRLRRHIDESLARGTTGERRAVLAGIVLGQDEGISDGVRAAFRTSGLYHLLAVSGQNVVFIVAGVLGLFWLLGLPRVAGHVAAIGAIGAYVLAVGWQPSVARAGIAGGLASLAWLSSRSVDRWHFLTLGALVLLAWTPASLLDPGFQLSFAAVAAIFVAVPALDRRLEGYPLPKRLADVVGVAFVCGLATAPILWLQFGYLPLYTILANALAAPVVGSLLGLGLLAAVLEPVLPSAAFAFSWAGGWLAAYLAACARLVASLPYARVSSPTELGILALAAIVLWLTFRLPPVGRLVVAMAALVALLSAGTLHGGTQGLPPPTGLRVVFLDVGQGDSTLLQVATGSVLVDEGPPEAHVGKQLRALGIRQLTVMVLTHPQRDHVGGAAEVLRTLHVDELLDPAIPSQSPDERAALDQASRHDVPVLVARAGAVYRIGHLTLHVLWPDGPGSPSDDPNNHAVVIQATYGSTDVLLTADAESDVTGRLPLQPIEVLKVAHHGSEDHGLPAELQTLHPRVAVISVGAHNDYGHPRPDTVAALLAVPGLSLFRTDRNGRVIVESDGRSLTVRTQR